MDGSALATGVVAGRSARWLRLATAKLLSVLHTGIIALFLLGWALPWREALWMVVAAAVIVRVGWWLFDDQCLLSILEKKLLGEHAPAVQRLDGDDEQPNFIADCVTRILGRPLPLSLVNNAIYGVLWTSFSIASLRLATGW